MKKLFNNPDAVHVVINPRTGKKYAIPRSVKAGSYTNDHLVPLEEATTESSFTVKDIWDMIIKNAWSNGEPGILFEDEINRANSTPHISKIEATNPCGEQPLHPYEACILGSIDVSKFVNTGRTDLDWDKLAETISLAVRFLDNEVDANCYPIAEIREVTLASRRIGLGVMGFAYMLILLGIRYGSQKSIEFAGQLASFIQKHAHNASEQLAKERGCFPNWKGSLWDVKYHRPMRNAACTTIAPTGSISRIAGTSSSIEPIYSITIESLILDGQKFIQLDPLVERLGTEQGWLTNGVRDLLVQGTSPRDIPEIPTKLAEVLVTAHEVKPEDHVKIQAEFQKNMDNAVSKTVNLPSSATVEDVDKVFRLAHELNCKGITVYRDGSRKNQVLKNAADKTSNFSPRPRPHKTHGETIKYRMGCGKLYVTVNKDEKGQLFETFANLGKAGGCPAQSEATSRLVSTALRAGISPQTLIQQLKGIRCLSTVSRKNLSTEIEVLSCPDAIARAIMESMGEVIEEDTRKKCPDCGEALFFESGCDVCKSCGYSKCD